MQANTKNRNGRIYPREILQKEAKRYNTVFIQKKRAFGELGHPDGPTVNLERVSHMIEELQEVEQKTDTESKAEMRRLLLAEMDEQVDVYRERGKNEAASRLEDQLHLIHEKFQELVMKFELFQNQGVVEYEARLTRVARQLREIREKLYLTEQSSLTVEAIQGHLHHAYCIYNALSGMSDLRVCGR